MQIIGIKISKIGRIDTSNFSNFPPISNKVAADICIEDDTKLHSCNFHFIFYISNVNSFGKFNARKTNFDIFEYRMNRATGKCPNF